MDKKFFEQKEAMEDKKIEFTSNYEDLQDFGREIRNKHQKYLH